MQKKRTEIVEQLHKKGLEGKVPKHILVAFCHNEVKMQGEERLRKEIIQCGG